MTIPTILQDLDSILALLEDSTHGSESKLITEKRGQLQKAISELKCEMCEGFGGHEKYVEPYGDSPIECSFCGGTGIDKEQLEKQFKF